MVPGGWSNHPDSLKISLALEIADDYDSLCAYSPVNTIAQ